MGVVSTRLPVSPRIIASLFEQRFGRLDILAFGWL
jgi:hypothetical protein